MSEETEQRQEEAAGRPDSPAGQAERWERDLLNRLAFAALNEQRRARRWGIFFKSLAFLYLFLLLVLFGSDEWFARPSAGRHTALVDVQGVIADFGEASADNVIASLRAAFEDEETAGVILRINSPGGSPVQAGEIYDEIRRLREEYPDTPLYAVVTDICASGGYYIAAASDAIYANKASIVGSIGVLMDGFGFVGTMEKLGIERRLYTAGENKGFLDPFSPRQPGEVSHLRTILGAIHQQFVDAVKVGRGERLKNDPRLFSGLIWTGEEGVKLGLVDALGSTDFVAREVIGVEEIVDYTPQPPYLEQVFERFGTTMANVLTARMQPAIH